MMERPGPQTNAVRQRKKDRVSELLDVRAAVLADVWGWCFNVPRQEDTLDTEEQEELLNEFSRLHRQDEIFWSVLWGMLGVLVCLVYFAFATRQLVKPLEAFLHAQLRGGQQAHA